MKRDQDSATARHRMARESSEARYEAIAKTCDEIQAEREQVACRIEELTKRPAAITAVASPEERVEALMLAIDEIAAVTKDEMALQRIRPLVLRLGIWIGLEFEEGRWGKRLVRGLRRGVIAFGSDGSGNSRTDEPISGMEQTHPGSHVGATRFERATSTSRTHFGRLG